MGVKHGYFNSHPREGGDILKFQNTQSLMCCYFNSHPREGGDEEAIDEETGEVISIPTPAKGVTRWP